MNHEADGTSPRSFFEIEIHVYPSVLWSYVLSRHGLWRDLTSFVLGCIWLLSGCVFQCALPNVYPALPLWPVCSAVGFLAIRRGVWWAWLGGVFAGLVIDSQCYSLFFLSPFLLALGVVVCRVVYDHLSDRLSFIWRSWLVSVLMVLLYVGGRLVFDTSLGLLEDRLRQVPLQLLGGMLLGGCFGMLSHGIMALVERLLIGRGPREEKNAA